VVGSVPVESKMKQVYTPCCQCLKEKECRVLISDLSGILVTNQDATPMFTLVIWSFKIAKKRNNVIHNLTSSPDLHLTVKGFIKLSDNTSKAGD